MPTTITKSIGTSSRDYSTIQAWEDAAPASIVASDEIWRGEMYNDSEFGGAVASTYLVTFGGVTVDATRYRILTVATGQSFQDHASVRSNGLRYNQSNGVGIKQTGNYGLGLSCNERYVRLSRFQISMTHSNAEQAVVGGQDCIVSDLIVEHSGNNGGANSYLVTVGQTGYAINVAGFAKGAACKGFRDQYDGHWINCTLVKSTDVSDTNTVTAFKSTYNTHITITNCAVFGYTNGNFTSATTSTSGGNNATDLSSGAPGSSNQHSVTFNATTPFTQASSTSTDLRAIAATSLAANGSKDATNAPNDISATVRASACTIGAWELTGGGGGGGGTPGNECFPPQSQPTSHYRPSIVM